MRYNVYYKRETSSAIPRTTNRLSLFNRSFTNATFPTVTVDVSRLDLLWSNTEDLPSLHGNVSELSSCLSVSTTESLSPQQNLTSAHNSMRSFDVMHGFEAIYLHRYLFV